VETSSSTAPTWPRSFARHDLIDEYRLYVHPVVVGRGTAMLRPSDVKVSWQLIETRTFGNGVVMLRYKRHPLGPQAASIVSWTASSASAKDPSIR